MTEIEYEKQLGLKDMELKEKEVRIAELEKKNAKLKRIVKMVAMINKGVYSNEGIEAIYKEAGLFLKEINEND